MDAQLDSRHVARALALQRLFNKLTEDTSELLFSETELLDALEVEEYDKELYNSIVKGVEEKTTEIDPVISKLAPAWPIEQIAPIDLLILRMGIWEGFLAHITPAKVVINECIELAKEFGGPASSSFVNGVLGTLLTNEELQKTIRQ